MALLAAPLSALASPSGALTHVVIDNTGCPLLGPSTLTCMVGNGSATLNDPGHSFASAQADLAAGSLAIATATDSLFGHYASALAEIWDTFAFSGVTAGEKATVTISGTAAVAGSYALQYFADLVPAGNISAPNGGNGELVTLLANGAWSISMQFPIANGTLDNGAYTLNAGLYGTSDLCGNDGCPGSIAAAATVTFTLPTDVTLTSDQGFGTAAPEPGALALGALPLLLVFQRRRPRLIRR